MAAHIATIINAAGNSTDYAQIKWSSFDSAANNIVFPTKGNVDASRMLILLAAHSTLDNRIWIGTSDSRSSAAKNTAAFVYPGSAAKLGRMMIKTTKEVDGATRSKFLSTVAADTEVFAIYALGPFETARFADSDGYINVCRGITTVGAASHSSDAQWIAAIQIP